MQPSIEPDDVDELREQPTQTRHPWRATLRTTIAAAISILPALPEIARITGTDTLPIVASVLAIAAMITRVLAIPEVDRLVDRYLPGLSADMGYIENREDRNNDRNQ